MISSVSRLVQKIWTILGTLTTYVMQRSIIEDVFGGIQEDFKNVPYLHTMSCLNIKLDTHYTKCMHSPFCE